jgi:hypothetical protein
MTDCILDRKGVAALLGKSLAQLDRYRRYGDPPNGRPPLNDIALPPVGRTPRWREIDVRAWAGLALTEQSAAILQLVSRQQIDDQVPAMQATIVQMQTANTGMRGPRNDFETRLRWCRR